MATARCAGGGFVRLTGRRRAWTWGLDRGACVCVLTGEVQALKAIIQRPDASTIVLALTLGVLLGTILLAVAVF
jgi:hypothetical protein